MKIMPWVAAMAAFAISIGGCAGLRVDYETPTVSLSSFRALPSEGMAPRFEIGLQVVNPNPTALALEGISYTVELEGHRVLTGVARDLPEIEAYGQGEVVVVAAADLLSGIGLITDLMKQPRQKFAYRLAAKLDPVGISPRIHVTRNGEISLGSSEN